MAAEVLLADHPAGTEHRVIVRHGNPGDRDRHEELGFFDSWGSVIHAPAEFADSGVAA